MERKIGSNSNTVNKREIGIDIIKVLACIGVVALHTLVADLGLLNRTIAYLAGMSVPLFFVVNGYLMFSKAEVTYRYVLIKIVKILCVCFAWELLHAIAYFCYYKQWRDFLSSFFLDFLQQGLFYHFWFMGALIILYLILPLLHKLKYNNSIYIITLGLGVLCVAVDIVMLIINNRFILFVPQSLRLHFWLFYYLLGGIVALNKAKIKERIRKNCIAGVFLIATLIMYFAFFFILFLSNRSDKIEAFYGSFPMIIAVLCVFVRLMCIEELKFGGGIITCTSRLIMGIYIIHPFVLAAIVHFIPVFSENSILNLLFCIVTLLVCGLISLVISKIPLMKQLIRL